MEAGPDGDDLPRPAMPPPRHRTIGSGLSLGCYWRHGCKCLGDLASWGSQCSFLMENCLLPVRGASLRGSEHPITGQVWGYGGGLDSSPGFPKETVFELNYKRTCRWSGELFSLGAQGLWGTGNRDMDRLS